MSKPKSPKAAKAAKPTKKPAAKPKKPVMKPAAKPKAKPAAMAGKPQPTAKPAGGPAFDPRGTVHACIEGAANGRPFGPATKLKNIPAPPDDVRTCINGSIPLKGDKRLRADEVTGEDTENSLTLKTRNKMQ
jgi:hypothetical protein